MPSEDLRALVEGLAHELGDVSSADEGGVDVHRRGATVFARAARDVLEVRLPADIAEAALRTPDTAPGGDGSGWVRFTPGTRERHVTDRAEAWFRTAWRHATER